MQRYDLRLRDGTSEIIDPDKAEFATVEHLRRAALTASRGMIGHDAADGVRNLRSA
jgi:hypothetical protein